MTDTVSCQHLDAFRKILSHCLTLQMRTAVITKVMVVEAMLAADMEDIMAVAIPLSSMKTMAGLVMISRQSSKQVYLSILGI